MKLSRRSLLKGTLLAAIGFEILKTIMTWLLPNMAASRPVLHLVRLSA